MGKKIIGAIGGIFGLGGKKKAAAAPEEKKGPVVTQLSEAEKRKANPRAGLRGSAPAAPSAATIISDKLGN